MVLTDGDVINAIKKLGEHYRKNISNKYIRKGFNTMQIDLHAWELIDDLAKETTFFGDYRFDELYERILAMAEFVSKAKKQLLPNIRTLVVSASDSAISRSGSLTANEKLLRDIAVSNFPANLAILADLVNDLYVKVVEYDRKTHGPSEAAYNRMQELSRIGELLV
ncbi:MAG: hypothetical protein E4H36_13775 [Spirochaetales bacterium]|nr:MAG: hypothetical protein E4H36_13775 [Spirochaetales bacterium]